MAEINTKTAPKWISKLYGHNCARQTKKDPVAKRTTMSKTDQNWASHILWTNCQGLIGPEPGWGWLHNQHAPGATGESPSDFVAPKLLLSLVLLRCWRLWGLLQSEVEKDNGERCDSTGKKQLLHGGFIPAYACVRRTLCQTTAHCLPHRGSTSLIEQLVASAFALPKPCKAGDHQGNYRLTSWQAKMWYVVDLNDHLNILRLRYITVSGVKRANIIRHGLSTVG